MKVCKKCKKQVPNKLKICRYCGADVSKAKIIPSNKKSTKTSTKVQKNIKEQLPKDIIDIKEMPKQEVEIKVQKEITEKPQIIKKHKLQSKPKKIKNPKKKIQKIKLSKKTTKKTNNKFEKIKQILLTLKNKKNLKRIIVSIIVLTLVITITLSGIKLYHKLFDIGEEVKPNENTTKIFDINETIRYKDVNYKVKKVEINETGTEYKKPKDGNQFIIITVQYENKSDEPVNYSSRNWKLENEDKEETQRIFTALDVNTALYSGKLVIGATKVGTLVFEQSKKYDSFKLNFYELKEEKKEEKETKETKENIKEDKKTVNEDEKNTEEEKEKPIFSINIKIENKDKDKDKEKSKEESKNKATQTTKKDTKDKELSKK